MRRARCKIYDVKTGGRCVGSGRLLIVEVLLLAEFGEECDQYGDESHHSEDAEHSLPRDEQRDLKICHSAFLLTLKAAARD